MRRSLSYRSSVRRFFHSGFSAQDIAQSLISYDAARPAPEVKARMVLNTLRVAGLRFDGYVVGYVFRDELGEERCLDYLRPIEDARLLDHEVPLHEALVRVAEQEFVFVRTLGEVGGIITRSDLGKPPVRMWIFGLLTVMESAFARKIRRLFPDEGWRNHLSSNRRRRAEHLQTERQRRKESPDVIDCLQFSDKAQILFKNPGAREELGIRSWTAGKQLIKDLERLRNSLAHAQGIVESSSTIATLAAHVDAVLDLYDGEAASMAERTRPRPEGG
ncbi:MAG: hypothetical protein ACYTDU_03350 [Planctomycetota bacterium]|jgi:hypothetical protein